MCPQYATVATVVGKNCTVVHGTTNTLHCLTVQNNNEMITCLLDIIGGNLGFRWNKMCAICFNSVGTGTTYAKIVNKSGSTTNVQVTLTYVALEA